jgi:NAD(P)-dependent dehydrogenase (short-subunit alcohol dehydrogenase family)
MDLDLTDKTALVTGSTRGIGLVTAIGLAQMGAEVIVNGRDKAAVGEAVAKVQQAAPSAKVHAATFDLGDGSPAIECTLCDASQEGALLAVAEPDGVPDEFILALTSGGAARRRCRVAWRTENQIGVEFLKDLKKNAPRAQTSAPHARWKPNGTSRTSPNRIAI